MARGGALPLTEEGEDDLCPRQARYVGQDESAQTGAPGEHESAGSLKGREGLELRTAGKVLSVPPRQGPRGSLRSLEF